MKNDQLSKFLSYVLRHKPDAVGIELDPAGWTSISELIAQCNAHGNAITRELLDAIVRTDSKGRYAISEDGLRIRANQGHSVEVELGYEQRQAPAVLYHGTPVRFLDSILKSGLDKMKRHHVHLSLDVATATTVGLRRGKPAVLKIDAHRMEQDGHVFYLSANGVWLTDRVPPEYLEVLDGGVAGS
jgi:putative RNA 2'-phosphotransferase